MREPYVIEGLLLVWQRWAFYRIDHALGYQRSSVLHRVITEGLQGASIRVPAGSRVLPTDEVAEAVEAAIVSLPAELRRIVIAGYLVSGTRKDQARTLRMGYEVFRKKLALARGMLADALGV